MVYFHTAGDVNLICYQFFNSEVFFLFLIHRANEQNKEVGTSLCNCCVMRTFVTCSNFFSVVTICYRFMTSYVLLVQSTVLVSGSLEVGLFIRYESCLPPEYIYIYIFCFFGVPLHSHITRSSRLVPMCRLF